MRGHCQSGVPDNEQDGRSLQNGTSEVFGAPFRLPSSTDTCSCPLFGQTSREVKYIYIYIYIPLVASFLAHPVVLSSTGLVELLGPLDPLGPLSSLGPFGPLGPLGPFGFPRMSCCVFTIRHVFSCASGGAIGGGPSAPCAWGRAHCALEPVGPFGPLGPTAHWSAEFP